MHHLLIFMFICLSNRMITLQLCYHLTALAPPKVILVLVLFVIFQEFLNSLLYRWAFVGFSCCFGGLSYSLLFSLLRLLQHALSQRLGGSWLWAWAYSPLAFIIHLGLFRSPLLWMRPPVLKLGIINQSDHL